MCSALRDALPAHATQLMTESAIPVLAGGAAGALVAFWLQRWLIATTPAGVPRLDQVGSDGRLSAWPCAASLAGALAGSASSRAIVAPCREPPASAVAALSGSSAADADVGGQIARPATRLRACSVTVARGAATLRSLQYRWQVRRSPRSLRRTAPHVVQVRSGRARSITSRSSRRRQLFEALADAPHGDCLGIAAATPAVPQRLSARELGWDATFTREGQGAAGRLGESRLHLKSVRPDYYFRRFDTPILRGRAFRRADRQAQSCRSPSKSGESLARAAPARVARRRQARIKFVAAGRAPSSMDDGRRRRGRPAVSGPDAPLPARSICPGRDRRRVPGPLPSGALRKRRRRPRPRR